MKHFAILLAFVLLTVALTGCATGPGGYYPAPTPAIGVSYQQIGSHQAIGVSYQQGYVGPVVAVPMPMYPAYGPYDAQRYSDAISRAQQRQADAMYRARQRQSDMVYRQAQQQADMRNRVAQQRADQMHRLAQQRADQQRRAYQAQADAQRRAQQSHSGGHSVRHR